MEFLVCLLILPSSVVADAAVAWPTAVDAVLLSVKGIEVPLGVICCSIGASI